MQLTVSGRHVDISEAFKTHVSDALEDINTRHHVDPVEAAVIISKQGHLFLCDVTLHMSKNVYVRAQGSGTEGYGSFDDAARVLTGRLRRHMKRLRDHHRHHDVHPSPAENVPYFVLNAETLPEENASEDMTAAVVAETTKEIPTLSVGDAVMRMDLSDVPAYVFRNARHGRINFLYRRGDGHIGWVDPQA